MRNATTIFACAALMALAAAGENLSSVSFGSALSPFVHAAEDGRTPLHVAAASGEGGKVKSLLEGGADVNVKDALGQTPLHYAAAGGHQLTCQALIDARADVNAADSKGLTPLDMARRAGHRGTAAFLVEKGALPGAAPAPGESIPPTEAPPLPTGDRMKGDLEYPTAEAYSKALGEEGVIIENPHVLFFAPKSREREARVIAPYLERAYQEFYKVVGVHTNYRIVVYHFPEGHPMARGGTSNCVIRYGYDNLALEKQPEWTRHRVPHLSGYIEEMGHNFVDSTKAEFGWEMIGWTLGVGVTNIVAGNPIHTRQVRDTLNGQNRTYRRYREFSNTFPRDLPSNQADRIHAYLLWQCEKEYGENFWPDFFSEIRNQRARLYGAVNQPGDTAVRDERYRITIECFDRLEGIDFKKLLTENGVSTTTAIQSLVEKPGWNRKFE